MTTATIAGVGAALPATVLGNDHFIPLGTSHEWIVKRTGIHTRHWLGPGETLAGLAEQACREALADAGRDAREVDHVVVSTVTPDRITPGIAPGLATRLGAPNPPALDLNAACAGFLYALDHACAQIESGRARCVLVCAAEALSRITDTTDRSTAVLFGDAAGAVVVTPAGPGSGERPSFRLGSDGRHEDLLYADPTDRLLRMSGREVYEFAVGTMVEQTRAVLAGCGLSLADVGLFIGHQANARILRAVAAELGVPASRTEISIEHVGNTSSASIPFALRQARKGGRLRPGDRIAMAAFGAGFVWGAGVIRWKALPPEAPAHPEHTPHQQEEPCHR
ncbi:3-oxoacyl-ACP synthase III family protein [Streptomyces sp. NPDC008001]|uniref:3-oxoacyl-ACP synthase III family protein n=1 Tax=Streptomyces sp. NPDC008001 TaxID=3364804 RepID=UPI0036E23997